MNAFNTPLLIAVGCIAAYLVFDLIPGTIHTYEIFKHIKDNYEDFRIEYADCEDLSDKIALYLIRNF